MKRVAIIGCGAYMDSGYGCPGEWRCLKACATGEGKMDEPAQVVAFVRCECPGRATVPSLGMALRLSEIRPDEVRLSSCLVEANPRCPYMTADELAQFVGGKFNLPVVPGTHDYH